jgi:hypothetical protein
MLLWTIAFTTDRFRPFLPEPCQVNGDLYGFELAAWLAETLADNGVITSYPAGEDWGWFLEYLSDSRQELTIGCASIGATNGYPTDWRIFIRQRRRPLKGGADSTLLLTGAILSALSAAGIECRQL